MEIPKEDGGNDDGGVMNGDGGVTSERGCAERKVVGREKRAE